jgi:UDP-N-acetylmuramate--alanine ligase
MIKPKNPMQLRVNHMHFIGAGGSGMSGIIEVLLNLHFKITGSDQQSNAVTERLVGLGATIFQGHHAEQIKGAQVVVISTAVAADNPEVLAARANNIPIIPRAQMLAELMRFAMGIAIAGTHGKTTTTSLTASVLGEGGLDPTFVIGGKLLSAGANAQLGKSDIFVAEADESDASFLLLTPSLAVITNIDEDHMDTYEQSVDKLMQAFIDFAKRLPFYGCLYACVDDAKVAQVLPRIPRPIVTYGLSEQAMIRATQVRPMAGQMQFVVLRQGFADLPITLNLPGVHNVLNALAAIAIAQDLAVEPAAIQRALQQFQGVGRRFQHHGQIAVGEGHATVVDDYGHHPMEMAATIAAVRGAYPEKRLLLAFQPHRYSRTRDLFDDFVNVLATVDCLVLTEVYPAGEQPIVAANSKALARALRVTHNRDTLVVDDIGQVAEKVLSLAQAGDLILTMGAGTIGGIAAKLVSLSKEAA